MIPAADEFEALLLGSTRCDCFALGSCGSIVSAKSLKACAFMSGVDPVFFRCGFVMGDFPTLVLDLVFATLVFLAFLTRSPVPIANVWVGFVSKSISSGELVVVMGSPRSKTAIGSDWACNAGEVKGLKYVLGTANCCSIGNWLSKGVTAGDTNGVKDICKRVLEDRNSKNVEKAGFHPRLVGPSSSGTLHTCPGAVGGSAGHSIADCRLVFLDSEGLAGPSCSVAV